METEKTSFSYSYRGGQQKEDNALRERYHLASDVEITQEIRNAPQKEESVAVSLSLTMGILSVLVFGGGLSLALLHPASALPMIFGILLGMTGMAGMAFTPLFHKRLQKEMRRRTEKLIRNGLARDPQQRAWLQNSHP